MTRFPLLVLLALAACDSGSEPRPERTSERAVMRPYLPVPEGARPRGAGAFAAAVATPPPANPASTARGGVIYRDFCLPCHGPEGAGDGPVAARGYPAPPRFSAVRERIADPAHTVGVVTNGYGRMLPMDESILPADRWAVARYVQELEQRGSGRP